MGEHVTLLKVEMNANVDLFRCYHAERHRISQENGGDANEMWMWHATQRSKEDNILQQGLDTNFCGLDFEYYGAGIYLAPDSKLSNDYAASSRNTEYPSNRSMLLVRVACGKVFDERHPLKLHPKFQEMLELQTQQNLTPEQTMQQQKDKFRELLRYPYLDRTRVPSIQIHETPLRTFFAWINENVGAAYRGNTRGTTRGAAGERGAWSARSVRGRASEAEGE